MIVGVIGLGLIGGSMAIDLKRRGFAGTVLGVETDPVNAAAARKMELVDEVVPFGECIRRSDITRDRHPGRRSREDASAGT